MASLPIFCRDVIKGDELIATIYLAVISIGMGVRIYSWKQAIQWPVKNGHVEKGNSTQYFAFLFSLTTSTASRNFLL